MSQREHQIREANELLLNQGKLDLVLHRVVKWFGRT